MMISTALGTSFSLVIYVSFGFTGSFIYRYNINGTFLTYLGDELINFMKINKKKAAILIIFEIAFKINTSISLVLNFFVAKTKSLGLAKIMVKKYQRKKTDESTDGTALVSLDERGYSTEKPGRKDSEEITLNEISQIILTLVSYSIIIVIAYY